MISIQDQERARLARDFHDGICQSLSAVTLMWFNASGAVRCSPAG